MVFKLYSSYAKLEIYLNHILVVRKIIDVYDKETFDLDLVIDIFQ